MFITQAKLTLHRLKNWQLLHLYTEGRLHGFDINAALDNWRYYMNMALLCSSQFNIKPDQPTAKCFSNTMISITKLLLFHHC